MFYLTNSCSFAAHSATAHGAECSVPKNYFINGAQAEGAENALFFEPQDHHFQVSYKIHLNSKGTEESLIETQMGIYGTCQPISPITLDGLSGHCATYGDEKEQYFEARLCLEETETGCTELEFTVLTHHGDIEDIKASPAFKTLLAGIRKG